MNFFGKQAHLFQYRLNIRNDVFVIEHDRFAAWRTQCRMQYGTMFRRIDFIAGKQCFTLFFQMTLPLEFDKQPHRFVRQKIFREIEKQSAGCQGHGGKTVRMIGKKCFQRPCAGIFCMSDEFLKYGGMDKAGCIHGKRQDKKLSL